MEGSKRFIGSPRAERLKQICYLRFEWKHYSKFLTLLELVGCRQCQQNLWKFGYWSKSGCTTYSGDQRGCQKFPGFARYARFFWKYFRVYVKKFISRKASCAGGFFLRKPQVFQINYKMLLKFLKLCYLSFLNYVTPLTFLKFYSRFW